MGIDQLWWKYGDHISENCNTKLKLAYSKYLLFPYSRNIILYLLYPLSFYVPFDLKFFMRKTNIKLFLMLISICDDILKSDQCMITKKIRYYHIMYKNIIGYQFFTTNTHTHYFEVNNEVLANRFKDFWPKSDSDLVKKTTSNCIRQTKSESSRHDYWLHLSFCKLLWG